MQPHFPPEGTWIPFSMFEKMEEWALLYVTGFLPKGGPKIAIPPDTLLANQLIQRDTRVGTLFVPTQWCKPGW